MPWTQGTEGLLRWRGCFYPKANKQAPRGVGRGCTGPRDPPALACRPPGAPYRAGPRDGPFDGPLPVLESPDAAKVLGTLKNHAHPATFHLFTQSGGAPSCRGVAGGRCTSPGKHLSTDPGGYQMVVRARCAGHIIVLWSRLKDVRGSGQLYHSEMALDPGVSRGPSQAVGKILSWRRVGR